MRYCYHFCCCCWKRYQNITCRIIAGIVRTYILMDFRGTEERKWKWEDVMLVRESPTRRCMTARTYFHNQTASVQAWCIESIRPHWKKRLKECKNRNIAHIFSHGILKWKISILWQSKEKTKEKGNPQAESRTFVARHFHLCVSVCCRCISSRAV